MRTESHIFYDFLGTTVVLIFVLIFVMKVHYIYFILFMFCQDEMSILLVL